jgi:hypothetical protein
VEAIDPVDAEGGLGLTYTLTGGADELKFDIDFNLGILLFKVAPDFDIPGDADGDNVYHVQVTVTDSGPGELLTDVQDIAVTVTNVNEYPDIVSNDGGLEAVPNPILVGEGTRHVTFVEAVDPDTMPIQTLTFEILDGPDADKFEFADPSMGLAPATSALKFNFDTDFDNPVDSNGDNIYEVRVKVTDNGIPYLSDTQRIFVEVIDSNENPVITSDGGGDTAAVEVPENTAPVTIVTATDPDVPAQCPTFQIIGGADAAAFTWGLQAVCGWTRPLRFAAPLPDFEFPADADGDNVYEVLVMVTDNGTPPLNDTQLIHVTVTDVNDESPIFTSPAGVSHPENSTAKIVTITATDLEADCGPPAADCTGVQTLAFSIVGGADSARFELLNPVGSSPYSVDLHFKEVPPNFEGLEDADNNNQFEVTVRATDVGAPGPAPLFTDQAITVTLTDVNENPTITSANAFVIPENELAVTTLTATDPEGTPPTIPQTLTWSITGGADATKLAITAGGALSFALGPYQGGTAEPNFENPLDADNNNVYELEVTVTDNGPPGPPNLTDVMNIVVTVTDINEQPQFTFPDGLILHREGEKPVQTLTAVDPDADCGGQPATDSCTGLQTLVFSIDPTGGADHALFQIVNPTADSPWSAGLEFIAAPDFENDLSDGGNNVYFVTVRVEDSGAPLADGLFDEQLVQVEVIDQNDFAPHIITPEKDSYDPDIAYLQRVEGAEFVTIVHAIDIDTPAQEISYLKANGGIGGPDGALFDLDPVTGELRFIAPAVIGGDANGDSVYEVFVIARDADVPVPNDSAPLAILIEVVEVCTSTWDSDGDRLPDCVETNDGVFSSENQTGTDPFNPDTDGDFIWDGDEVLGTLDGLALPAMGLSPLRKNILLEYDWFDDSLECAAHSHEPTQASIDMMTAAFDAAPIANPDGTTGITVIQDYGQGGAFTGGNQIADTINVAGNLDGGVNGAEFQTHKNANFAANRNGYFHYVLMVHRYGTDSGSSGQAELPGDDLIVSSICWGPGDDQGVANTIMHELGHNLKLRHGGFENLNWKPNYNSIMNYKYQFPGIDDCADADPNGDGIMDFSIGDRPDLDENDLDENLGICTAPVLPWDWNGINGIESSISMDINLDGDPADPPNGDYYPDGVLEILSDWDDWGNIIYSGLSDGDGAPAPSSTSTIQSSSSSEIISCMNVPPSAQHLH